MSSAMHLLAEHKVAIYNEKYLEAIASPKVPVPAFNPASPPQKQTLFKWLNLESDKASKDTGLPSWDRDEVERINKTTDNPDIKHFTQCFIDHSFAAIVRNNFIEAFYKYTVNDRLHGQYKLLGAKSGRYTSSQPNMLNTPSTGSVFAKPIKECFTAAPGKLIAAIDYSALEDRVIASLSRDTNKCNVFLQNLDGHCLNAYGYFRERIAAEMPITGDTIVDVKNFFELTETNKTLKAIRQDGKPATFGLSYGSYPPKVAATLKISLAAATVIFDRYHNELYPGITDYRENYVLPTTLEHGRIHLGLGFYMKSDRPDKDIRVLNNGTAQFWSILTALTINKMHQLIDAANLQDHIVVTSTIYDSIYFEVDNDPTLIKWLNDNIIPVILTDFMEDQTIKNEANLEIGTSWADLRILQHNASVETIESTIKALYE
ncbi:MAG: DNA polymerase [Sulfuricurvum sp.]